MKRLIIFAALLMVGCRSHTSETTALMIDLPPYAPSYTGKMTVAEAAELLNLNLPVRVVHAASFEDGGTVEISIQDSKDTGYAFRRSPWARVEPVHYFIDYPKKNSESEKLEWDDPRLKALSVLALNWLDLRYTRKEQRRLFADDYLGELPFDDNEERASTVLWLFRKNEFGRQQ